MNASLHEVEVLANILSNSWVEPGHQKVIWLISKSLIWRKRYATFEAELHKVLMILDKYMSYNISRMKRAANFFSMLGRGFLRRREFNNFRQTSVILGEWTMDRR
jgi:hypothetical protein